MAHCFSQKNHNNIGTNLFCITYRRIRPFGAKPGEGLVKTA